MMKGTRNLAILGISIVLFALLTTSISLALYHNSGDIYLDRSRPGYLPDKPESSTKPADAYKFSDTGKLTAEDLDAYQSHYQAELKNLDLYQDAFAETPLSDDSLGI